MFFRAVLTSVQFSSSRKVGHEHSAGCLILDENKSEIELTGHLTNVVNSISGLPTAKPKASRRHKSALQSALNCHGIFLKNIYVSFMCGPVPLIQDGLSFIVSLEIRQYKSSSFFVLLEIILVHLCSLYSWKNYRIGLSISTKKKKRWLGVW